MAICQLEDGRVDVGLMSSEAKDRTSDRPGLVITAVGPDRPGLIFALSKEIRDLNGNIEDTKMSKLGGMFAVLMLVTGSETVLNHLVSLGDHLQATLGVTCSFAPTQAEHKAHGKLWTFSASGLDRPGIVTALSDLLASRHVNVVSFVSHVENAPLTGTPLFVLEAECVVPEGLSHDELQSQLQAACDREGLELLEP